MEQIKKELAGHPLAAVILFILLGGNVADFLSSNTHTTQLYEIQQDLDYALNEILDNSERISNNEEQIDQLRDDVRDINIALQGIANHNLRIDDMIDDLKDDIDQF